MLRAPDPVLAVDAAAVASNVALVRERAGGEPIWAVVKDGAYGHGLIPMARALSSAGLRHFCTAGVEEAVALRTSGIPGDVSNLRLFRRDETRAIADHGILQAVFTTEHLDLLSSLQRPVRVHVKIDTGMRRFGVPWEKAPPFIEEVRRRPTLRLASVFTTLAEDHDSDLLQIERFRKIYDTVKSEGVLGHLRSSHGILHHPGVRFGAVRAGSLLHGFAPSGEPGLPLAPVARLEAEIIDVRAYETGERLGYHSGPRFEKRTDVVFLGIGVSHGLDPRLAGRADVLIGGRRHRVLAFGSEYTALELGSGIHAKVGDRGLLLGPQGGDQIGITDWSRWTGESPYRVLQRLHPRLRKP